MRHSSLQCPNRSHNQNRGGKCWDTRKDVSIETLHARASKNKFSCINECGLWLLAENRLGCINVGFSNRQIPASWHQSYKKHIFGESIGEEFLRRFSFLTCWKN